MSTQVDLTVVLKHFLTVQSEFEPRLETKLLTSLAREVEMYFTLRDILTEPVLSKSIQF